MLSGSEAEQLAATHLEQQGFEIVDRNWRGLGCELDIIAKKRKRVHVIEVKYRKDSFHGDSLEYVNQSKRRQLLRGAKAWAHAHNWDGYIQIDVIGIEGKGVLRWIENAVYDE